MNWNCSACKIKIDSNNYRKDRTVCSSCYNKNKRKNNNVNTLSQNRQPEIDITIHKRPITKNKLENKTCHWQLVVGSSGCDKTYQMNHILHRKQEPIFIITKFLNQYPIIKAQTSDEIQHLEKYENCIVVFDDMFVSKQECNIDLFFTRGRHST